MTEEPVPERKKGTDVTVFRPKQSNRIGKARSPELRFESPLRLDHVDRTTGKNACSLGSPGADIGPDVDNSAWRKADVGKVLQAAPHRRLAGAELRGFFRRGYRLP